ncbi:LamG-like jellyroll fold domain-containing protein [Aeoliella sp.]|uniref:LamG-like jellyroll fold domain-containing protein n=1 Tax=Aeoliella sp. TaxID=2795800 RepID=UPI003CCC150B
MSFPPSRWSLGFIAALVLVTFCCRSKGGSLLLSDTGGKVFLSGSTSLGGAVTVEARLLFTDDFSGFGLVFNEYRFATEDKALYVGPESLQGYFLGASPPSRIVANRQIQLNVWHHVAWELSGGVERLYVDGQVVRERAAQGGVTDHAEGVATFGSNRGQDAMLGYIDWFRLSNSAAYGGVPFAPPTGGAAPISNPVMLFNFDQVGASSFSNEAGGAHEAVLGSFSQVVPSPAAPTMGDANGDGQLDTMDYSALWLGITNATGFATTYPSVELERVGDVNGSGEVDIHDAIVLSDWFQLPLPGDFNRDNQVSLADYTVWRNTLGANGVGLEADGDFDSDVDAGDYQVWKLAFGHRRSPLPSLRTWTVPEPETWIQCGLALTICGSFACRRGIH